MLQEKKLRDSSHLDDLMKDDENQKVLFNNLKNILSERKKTIADLSNATNISKNSISQLVSGKSQGIQFLTLAKILYALDISIEDLLVYNPPKINNVTIDLEDIQLDGDVISREYLTEVIHDETGKSDVLVCEEVFNLIFSINIFDDETKFKGSFPFKFWAKITEYQIEPKYNFNFEYLLDSNELKKIINRTGLSNQLVNNIKVVIVEKCTEFINQVTNFNL